MGGQAPVYWNHPGLLNGRIMPVHAQGQGIIQGDYYYEYYSYYTDHVFCIGEDNLELPTCRLSLLDTPSVSQALVDLTSTDVIWFTWNLRTHQDMTAPRILVNNGPATFKASGLFIDQTLWPAPYTDVNKDAMAGVEIPLGSTDLFAQDDIEHLLRVSGTALNDDDWIVVGVPWNEATWSGVPVASNRGRAQAEPMATWGQVFNGQLAALSENYTGGGSPVDEVAANATLTMLGLRWVARAYIDTDLRVELYEERPGRSWQRNHMAMNVSKATGTHTITITVGLEAYA